MAAKSLFVILAMFMILVPACDEKGGGEEPATGKKAASEEKGPQLDPGQEYTLESGQEDIEKVKAKDKTKLETSDCVTVLHAAGELEGVAHPGARKYVEEALQVCGHDVQLAIAKQGAEKIQKIRAEKPDEKFMSECTEVKFALENLAKYGHGDEQEITGIKTLYQKACE